MWTAIEFGFIIFVVIFIVMEIIIPGFKNTQSFPDFRSKKKEKPAPEPTVDEMIVKLKDKVVKEETVSETEIYETEIALNKANEKLSNIKDVKSKTDNL